MAKFYIIDITEKKNGQNPVYLFGSTDKLLIHLEGMCQRYFKKNRTDYMADTRDYGFGGDEPSGRAFYEQMEQYFNMGVIRNDSTPVRCNVFEAVKSSKSKDVHGD